MSLRDLIAAVGVALMKAGVAMQPGKTSYLYQRDKSGWRFMAGSDHSAIVRAMEAEGR